MAVTLALLEDFADRADLGDCSIVVSEPGRTGGSGLFVERRSAQPLSPASMIKTPLAAAVHALAEGGGGLEKIVVVAERNMTANDAESPLVPGFRSSLSDLVDLMLTRSDNVATNQILDIVGRERATACAHEWGLYDTHFRSKLSGADPLIDDPEATGRNAHPARDAARLFALLSADHLAGSSAIVAALRRQVWNTKLSRGWARGDRFAHKTGDTSEVSHDGGILDTVDGRRYVIVVYTPLAAGAEADDRMAHFASLLRPYL